MKIEEKFWKYVDKTPGLGPNDDCWEWTLYKMHKGYGHFMIDKKPKRAHRLAWEFTYGDPKSFYVLHKCDNRSCCNPAHLFLGTDIDNKNDMIKKKRQATGDVVTHKGVDHGCVKLTEDQVKETRDSDLSLSKLSKVYSIGKSQVYRIKTRKSWKHL